jgi:hypothetical protein
MESDNCNSAKQLNEGIIVNIPPHHQGIANALRTAFVPAQNSVPQDLAELLSQLR